MTLNPEQSWPPGSLTAVLVVPEALRLMPLYLAGGGGLETKLEQTAAAGLYLMLCHDPGCCAANPEHPKYIVILSLL